MELYKMMAYKIKKQRLLVPLIFSLPFSVGAVEITHSPFSSFVNDSHADLSLRNVFKNLSTEDYGSRSNQTA